MSQQRPDVNELWIQHQRRNHRSTQSQSWACIHCRDRKICLTADDLWSHFLDTHVDLLPLDEAEREQFRVHYVAESVLKRPRDDCQRKPESEQQSKRPLSSPVAPARSLSGLQTLNLGGGTNKELDDVAMQDISDENQSRKRPAIGDGISAGSASPYRDESPPPRRSKARPTSAPYASASDTDLRRSGDMGDNLPRPPVTKKSLWSPEQDSPLTKSSFDPSNIQPQNRRNQGPLSKPRKVFQTPPHAVSSWQPSSQKPPNQAASAIVSRSSNPSSQTQPKEELYDIVMQPETRPISQEQLVAEVKGIYAGLVMVEAKCIEVDNKQAALASVDPGAAPKLNNEQWQALIALHRTLLHEHHDFFLASQHPSASPALRRLACKYAMPARMWRHGIHSFLELLRHRLPASLDHMLAFIYLAYSMMALLYETVPAFEDTWIECLGDLGRYRMAIEDDDIRDREVWTGVARHWYSKASNKSPTTGRLYHHLAILARPNALQQLFYYSKSLGVSTSFVSARESILTLFDPVLNTDNGQTQYRLPPLDTAFVKAHALLFTNKEIETRFEPAMNQFLSLLDNQIGRVTRKFMEQGYQIAIANSVALLGFASKDNLLMCAISSSTKDDSDVQMEGTSPNEPPLSFTNAQRLNNTTLEIVLQRIGDPNVLPFIHVTLAFMYYMSRYPGAISILRTGFPWELLSIMLNTLLVSLKTTGPIENDTFPRPEKDDARPLPEDFALQGLIWTEDYFLPEWFDNKKIDEEDKYHERASMTAQRKEMILWLAVRIARSAGSGLNFDSGGLSNTKPEFTSRMEPPPSDHQQFESIDSATTTAPVERQSAWSSMGQSGRDVEVDAAAVPDPSSHV